MECYVRYYQQTSRPVATTSMFILPKWQQIKQNQDTAHLSEVPKFGKSYTSNERLANIDMNNCYDTL